MFKAEYNEASLAHSIKKNCNQKMNVKQSNIEQVIIFLERQVSLPSCSIIHY